MANNNPYSKNNNPYSKNNNPYSKNNNPYAKNQQKTVDNYQNKGNDPYKDRGVQGGDSQGNFNLEDKKYSYYNDLKILHDEMIYLSNSSVSSKIITILSKGQIAEIKMKLMKTILFSPFKSFFIIIFASIVLFFSNNGLVNLLAYMITIIIIWSYFLYPTKLLYNNVGLCVNEESNLFFKEMEFWFNTGVNLTKALFTISIMIIATILYYQDIIKEFLIKYIINSNNTYLISYFKSIGGLNSKLGILIALIVIMIISYFIIKKSEVDTGLKIRDEKIKSIRNEKISRVEQIQNDKNND